MVAAREIQTDANGKLVKVSNKSCHYQPEIDQLFSSLRIFAKKGIDLSSVKVEVVTPDRTLIYNSGLTFLETGGQCPPDHYKMASPLSEEFFLASLKKDERSQIVELALSSGSGPYFATQVFEELTEKGIKFNEAFKMVELEEDVFEYDGHDFLHNKGKSLPTNCDGGSFDREEKRITGLHMKKVDISPPLPKEAVNYQIQLLSRLKERGVDLTHLKLYDCNDVLISDSAIIYLQELTSKGV